MQLRYKEKGKVTAEINQKENSGQCIFQAFFSAAASGQVHSLALKAFKGFNKVEVAVFAEILYSKRQADLQLYKRKIASPGEVDV